jgi:AmmeMemoRadiSam system protein B
LDLEFIPSPLPDRPGLVVRDPYRYSDSSLIVPPLLSQCLRLLDGTHTGQEMRELLTRLTGRREVGDTVEALTRTLSEAGFLDDDAFHVMRAQRRRDFADAPLRNAAHAGGGYPSDQAELSTTLDTWMGDGVTSLAPGRPDEKLVAIAAPHVSPWGAPATYASAYGALPDDAATRTFVILGTSHYGPPGRYGLTRKPFQTPLGTAVTDTALVDQLLAAAPRGFVVEDYCHSIEHSIEFQVLFLQHRFGPAVRIVPILCGPLLARRPEDDDDVARALSALGELHAREGHRISWVLGVDMAHMGRRYGDDWPARAHAGEMAAVAERERARIDRIVNGDPAGFWELVQADDGSVADQLKWCGSAPLYSFLRAVPNARGNLLAYDQWNIDEESVVSFAALSFARS